jgi:hypothetical protein
MIVTLRDRVAGLNSGKNSAEVIAAKLTADFDSRFRHYGNDC